MVELPKTLIELTQLSREEQDKIPTSHLIKLGSKAVSKYTTTEEGGFVNYRQAKFSKDKIMYTKGLAGCLAILIQKKHEGGIMAHYPPMLFSECASELDKLKSNFSNVSNVKGVVLIEYNAVNEYKHFLTLLHTMFHTEFQTVTYDMERVGKVVYDPKKGVWESEEHKHQHV